MAGGAENTAEFYDPEEGVCAIGSGGSFALAASRALLKHTDLSAREVAQESLLIAADICVYTNDKIVIEELEAES